MVAISGRPRSADPCSSSNPGPRKPERQPSKPRPERLLPSTKKRPAAHFHWPPAGLRNPTNQGRRLHQQARYRPACGSVWTAGLTNSSGDSNCDATQIGTRSCGPSASAAPRGTNTSPNCALAAQRRHNNYTSFPRLISDEPPDARHASGHAQEGQRTAGRPAWCLLSTTVTDFLWAAAGTL